MGNTSKLMKSDKKKWRLFYVSAILILISDTIAGVGMSVILGLLESSNQTFFQPKMYLGVFLTLAPIGLIFWSTRIEIKIVKSKMIFFRKSIFKKILSMNYQEFYKKSRDEHLSHITNDISTFEKQYFSSLKSSISKIGVASLFLVVMAVVDYKLALILLILSALVFMLSTVFKSKMITMNKEVSIANSDYSKSIANLLSGMQIIKNHNAEKVFLGNTKKVIGKQEKLKSKYAFISGLQEDLITKIGTISTVVSLLYISYKISIGSFSFELAVFVLFIVNSVLQNIVGFLPEFARYKAAEKLIDCRLENEDQEVESKIISFNSGFDFKKAIRVIDLGYSFKSRNVFNNISIDILPSKKYLIQGPSGSGKTTFLNILTQRYQDYSGEVYIDGKSISDIEFRNFNHDVSIITQDVFLLEDSLLNNICLYKEYTQQKVDKAVKDAGLSHFVANSNHGIETVILDNGKELSGGERQRIAIARAIISEPKILFADEITSNLDHEVASKIEETLLNIDSTVVSITHRTFLGEEHYYKTLLFGEQNSNKSASEEGD